jgi:hypothetical protein
MMSLRTDSRTLVTVAAASFRAAASIKFSRWCVLTFRRLPYDATREPRVTTVARVCALTACEMAWYAAFREKK